MRAYALPEPGVAPDGVARGVRIAHGSDEIHGGDSRVRRCEAESCKVEIKLTYDYPVQGKIMRGIQTPLTETWVFDKGDAWLVFL